MTRSETTSRRVWAGPPPTMAISVRELWPSGVLGLGGFVVLEVMSIEVLWGT